MTAETNQGTKELAVQFQEILAERKVSLEDFRICISRHACRTNFSPRNVIIARELLNKQFDCKTMTPTIFRKGLSIIGMTPAEIKKVFEPA